MCKKIKKVEIRNIYVYMYQQLQFIHILMV